ncbi:hypothetical protein GJ496_010780, partial [Pomphorhynchus laevis]
LPLRSSGIGAGSFYEVDNDMIKRLDSMNKCFEPSFRQTFQACKTPVSLLIREPMIELTDHINRIPDNLQNIKYVIYGREPGIGKSTVLFYSLCHAVKQNWLILNFQKASEIMQQQINLAEQNVRNSNVYDTPIESVAWLQNFATQNRDLLRNSALKTSEEYVWSLRESTPANTSILKIVELGCDRLRYSSDCIGVIVKEIKKQSHNLGFKILTAIDGVNAFYGSSWVRSEKREKLQADDLVFVRALKRLLKSDWSNAITVCTVGPEDYILEKPLGKRWHKRLKRKIYRTVRTYNEYYYDGPCTPLALLNFEGFRDMDPFIPIEVQKLTNHEFNQLFNLYYSKNWITDRSAGLQENKDVIKFLCACNPSELSRILSFI